MRLATDQYVDHHDVYKPENGNILAVVEITPPMNEDSSYRLEGAAPYGPVEPAWEYAYTDETDAPHMLFRAVRYPQDHPGILALISQNEN